MMTAIAQPDPPTKAELEYPRWIEQFDTLTAEDERAIGAAIAQLANPPLVSVVMTGNGTAIGSGAERSRTIASLRAQIYPQWEVLMALGGDTPDEAETQVRSLGVSSFDGALRAARGTYVTFVEAGDILPRHAIATMVLSLPAGPCLVYSDEDEFDGADRRGNPYFKPGWNPDLFLGQDYACRLAMLRGADAAGKGRGAPSRRAVYDLLLQVTRHLPASAIRHVPHVLYHRWAGRPLDAGEGHLMRRSVEEHVQSLPRQPGQPAPTVSSIRPGLHRIDWRLPPTPPKVSIVIPTRDHVELLRTCVEGLRLETDYPDLEIIIIDNGSVEAGSAAYFDSLRHDRRVRVLRFAGDFNYSAINNFGVAHATGEVIGLLNNDLRIHEPGWLRDMVSHAVRPGIGAVGALLWYADGTVQHAGVTLGIGGIASHIFKRHKPGSGGYHDRLLLAQDVSAVTAACMLVPRAVWNQVGGLDESFTVAYNDIDLCLRIRAAGHRIIWTPNARLYHLESASRGRDDNPEKLARFSAEKNSMRSRWNTILQNDPFFSPSLSLQSTDCRPAFPARATFPWRHLANHR